MNIITINISTSCWNFANHFTIHANAIKDVLPQGRDEYGRPTTDTALIDTFSIYSDRFYKLTSYVCHVTNTIPNLHLRGNVVHLPKCFVGERLACVDSNLAGIWSLFCQHTIPRLP